MGKARRIVDPTQELDTRFFTRTAREIGEFVFILMQLNTVILTLEESINCHSWTRSIK
jgi:hypothetical protein